MCYAIAVSVAQVAGVVIFPASIVGQVDHVPGVRGIPSHNRLSRTETGRREHRLHGGQGLVHDQGQVGRVIGDHVDAVRSRAVHRVEHVLPAGVFVDGAALAVNEVAIAE